MIKHWAFNFNNENFQPRLLLPQQMQGTNQTQPMKLSPRSTKLLNSKHYLTSIVIKRQACVEIKCCISNLTMHWKWRTENRDKQEEEQEKAQEKEFLQRGGLNSLVEPKASPGMRTRPALNCREVLLVCPWSQNPLKLKSRNWNK